MDQNSTTTPETEPAKPPGSAVVRLLLAGTFLALIVGVECAVAYYVFPTAEDVAMLAQAQQAVKGDILPATAAVPDEKELLDIKERHEIGLGEFGVTSYQPLSNTTLRIDFQLYGVVLAEDTDLLMKLLEENKHRYREQVLVIMRSAEMTDLTDAGLGLIKRKILEKTNRVLGRAILEEVIFSDFSFVEQ
jgi:flagellar FliL protein